MNVIGLMSGTSLDGVDLACCEFNEGQADHFSWRILSAETYPYSPEWVRRLAQLPQVSAVEYAQADVDLGHLYGRLVRQFCDQHHVKAQYVASHGHTIFHQPHLGMTAQIGDGNAIAVECGLPVIYDFRRHDVALGGQGAPLVPIGDELLFSRYQACLNLGGFSNISYSRPVNEKCAVDSLQRRVAFDISPCNMALNHLAHALGMPYDPDGETARRGKLDPELLRQLNALPYYSQPAPKSLGKEWYQACFEPLVEARSFPVEDKLRTVAEHISEQISTVLNHNGIRTLLVTGGGVHNGYLLERLRQQSPQCDIQVPDSQLIDYKEAVIFALLGYLRLQQRSNCLSLVTGARCDNIGGVIALP